MYHGTNGRKRCIMAIKDTVEIQTLPAVGTRLAPVRQQDQALPTVETKLAPIHPQDQALPTVGTRLASVHPQDQTLPTVGTRLASVHPQDQALPRVGTGLAPVYPQDQALPRVGTGLAPVLQQDDAYVVCSVGIMAYNEEANISHTIHALLEQEGPSTHIEEIIVVASGCTDRTVAIVREIVFKEPRVRLCIQEKREGKASAVNQFLKQATSPVVILISADVLPETSALEYLCAPFKDPKIGMVGGHPIPVNNPGTFMGHVVHLLWRLHDQLARIDPKLGEVIAFRNVIADIPSDSPVDEISIQALIAQLGYKLIYEPACIVYNKGPLTVRDFLKQRRRIYAGHLKVKNQQNYAASTMKIGPIVHQLIACRHFALGTLRRIAWT